MLVDKSNKGALLWELGKLYFGEGYPTIVGRSRPKITYEQFKWLCKVIQEL